jgi:hypothetical protein
LGPLFALADSLESSWWQASLPITNKKHLPDVHELSFEERQPYLIRAKPTALET